MLLLEPSVTTFSREGSASGSLRGEAAELAVGVDVAFLSGRQAAMGCGAAIGGAGFGDIALMLEDWPRHSTSVLCGQCLARPVASPTRASCVATFSDESSSDQRELKLTPRGVTEPTQVRTVDADEVDRSLRSHNRLRAWLLGYLVCVGPVIFVVAMTGPPRWLMGERELDY